MGNYTPVNEPSMFPDFPRTPKQWWSCGCIVAITVISIGLIVAGVNAML